MKRSVLGLITALFGITASVNAQWTTNGSNIYYNAGSVGIGITNPSEKLDVSGRIKSDYLILNSINSIEGGELQLAGSTGYNDWRVDNYAGSFRLHHSGTAYFNILSDGKIGIGLTNPMRELDIDGSIELSGSIYGKTTDHTYYTIANGGNYNHAFFTRTNTGASSERFRIEGGAIVDDILVLNSNFNVNSGQLYVVQSTGNVGVGITNPYSDLHVEGSFGIGKFTTSNTPGFMIDYADAGSGTTTFKQNRWGAHYYFKRNGSSGEETQFYLGAAGALGNRIDIYNANNEVKVKLHSTSDSYFMGGDIGIGTTSPSSKLHLTDPTNAEVLRVESNSLNSAQIYLRSLGAGGIGWKLISTADGASLGGGKFSIYGNADHRFVVDQNGNIGIGTTSPGNKLEVNGTARAREIIVEATSWPDYVFHPSYDLLTLSEIEEHIKEKGHLPEVPSAQEVEEGQHLGEMQQLLLKKIEELTLHTIEQQKLIQKQQLLLEEHASRIKQLEKEN